MKRICHLLILVSILLLSSNSFAGKKIYAEGDDLPSAIEATIEAVEKAAKKANRCVSKYPSIKRCKELDNGRWRCSGIRANQKGSCK